MQGIAPQSLASRAGVLVRGPGTSTSDSIPAALSDGELVIPADDVRRYGAAQIMAAVKQGGQDLPQPSLRGGIAHAATGGIVTDPFGPKTNDVTRVGNSYSGGNVGGSITVNGQAPGGTVSTYPGGLSTPQQAPTPAGPAAPTQPNGLAARATAGQPAATTPTADPVQPTPTRPLSSLAQPRPAIGMATGGQISWTGRPQPTSGVDQLLGALAQGIQRQQPAAQPAAAPQVQLNSADREIFSGGALGYAQGGLVSEDDLPLPSQVQPRAVDGVAVNAAGAAAPPTPMPLSQRALAGNGVISAQAAPPSQIAEVNRAAAQSRSLSAMAMDQARQGIGVPATPGLTIIGPADYANRNAEFNDSAQLRTVLARGAGPGRNGAAVFGQQLEAAAAPLALRAQQRETQVKEQGETQRAELQQQGLAAQALMQDRRQAESNGIQRERLQFEAAREDRAQAQALADQERKARIAQVDDLIVSGTPDQRKAAAAQKAALMGKGMDEIGKVGEVSTGIRKEFEGLPEVRNYKQALPSYRGIEDAVKRNTPMSDINIVYGIAKLYDPNSVVREGEYATVANAPGIPERVKGWVQYVAGGGKLTDEVKKQILTEAQSRMSTFDKEYGAARDRYSDIAKRSSADPSLVVPQDYQPLQTQKQGEPPQLAELRRRAANNPQLAQRLQAAGY
jgi:hypothetical protein